MVLGASPMWEKWGQATSVQQFSLTNAAFKDCPGNTGQMRMTLHLLVLPNTVPETWNQCFRKSSVSAGTWKKLLSPPVSSPQFSLLTLPARSHHTWYMKTGTSVTKTQTWKLYTLKVADFKQSFRRPSVSTKYLNKKNHIERKDHGLN